MSLITPVVNVVRAAWQEALRTIDVLVITPAFGYGRCRRRRRTRSI